VNRTLQLGAVQDSWYLQGPLHPMQVWRTMRMTGTCPTNAVPGSCVERFNESTWTMSPGDVATQAQIALWAFPAALVLGGVAGYFAGKRWG